MGERGEEGVFPAWTGSRRSVLLSQLGEERYPHSTTDTQKPIQDIARWGEIGRVKLDGDSDGRDSETEKECCSVYQMILVRRRV